MADTKLTALPLGGVVNPGDILYLVSNPGTSPVSVKVTAAQFLALIAAGNAKHASTHGVGGSDPLVNAAWTDRANVFTTRQTIDGTSFSGASLDITDAGPGAPAIQFSEMRHGVVDARKWHLAAVASNFTIQALNDAENAATSPLQLTRQGSIWLTGIDPEVRLFDSDAAVDQKLWRIINRSASLTFAATNDDITTNTGTVVIDRTGLLTAGALSATTAVGNVALKNFSNTFTLFQRITNAGGGHPRLYFENVSNSLNQKKWVIQPISDVLTIAGVSDDESVYSGTTVTITRPGVLSALAFNAAADTGNVALKNFSNTFTKRQTITNTDHPYYQLEIQSSGHPTLLLHNTSFPVDKRKARILFYNPASPEMWFDFVNDLENVDVGGRMKFSQAGNLSTTGSMTAGTFVWAKDGTYCHGDGQGAISANGSIFMFSDYYQWKNKANTGVRMTLDGNSNLDVVGNIRSQTGQYLASNGGSGFIANATNINMYGDEYHLVTRDASGYLVLFAVGALHFYRQSLFHANILPSGSCYCGMDGAPWEGIRSKTAVVIISDIREKEVHGKLENVLDLVDDLDPIIASLNSDPRHEKFPTFSAQDVQEKIDARLGTHIVHVPDDPTLPLGMAYDKLAPVMWQMIKELKAKVEGR